MYMTDNEMKMLKTIDDLIRTIQKIEFICERAKTCYIEEKDIDDILKLIRDN